MLEKSGGIVRIHHHTEKNVVGGEKTKIKTNKQLLSDCDQGWIKHLVKNTVIKISI